MLWIYVLNDFDWIKYFPQLYSFSVLEIDVINNSHRNHHSLLYGPCRQLYAIYYVHEPTRSIPAPGIFRYPSLHNNVPEGGVAKSPLPRYKGDLLRYKNKQNSFRKWFTRKTKQLTDNSCSNMAWAIWIIELELKKLYLPYCPKHPTKSVRKSWYHH